MVNVYGDYSETGYNNPYYTPSTQPATRAEADYQNYIGRQNRANVGLGDNYGEASAYSPPQQQPQAQPQPVPAQPNAPPVIAPVTQGAAYEMALEAERRGEAIDPYVLAKAKEQGYTGTIGTKGVLTPFSANRLAQVRQTAVRGNLWGTDADAFTAMNAVPIGKLSSPRFSPIEGSVTQRFAFDEYGKVLKGGKFEPAYNATGIPFNPKMGAGEYVYVGEFQYSTGEPVSRFYEKNVGSFVDFSQAGAFGKQEVIVRSGGSPGAFSRSLPEPFKSTVTTAEQKSPLEKANYEVRGALGIGAQAFDAKQTISEGVQYPSSAPAAPPSVLDNMIIGFTNFQKDVSNKIYSGVGGFFGVTGEQAKTSLAIATTTWEGIGNRAPLPPVIATAYGLGTIKETADQPVKAGAMAAVGVGMGAGFKSLDVVGSKAATIAVEQYPTVTKGFSTVMSVAPTVLGGLYAADVGIRATEGGKSFGAGTIAKNLGGISATEIAPLTAGGFIGYSAADRVLSRIPSLYTVPGETQIIASAKPEDVKATKATLDIFKNIERVESPIQNKPDLTQVTGVKENAAGIESIISKQDPTVFGRTVETGQMPKEWMEVRGVTKDVDFFTPRPSEAGKAIQSAYPEAYSPKSQTDFTALMSHETGQTALDIHPYPSGYAGGKVGFEAPSVDYIKAKVNPIPNKAGILTTEGLPQEKLYVQTRRKATSVLGEEVGQFGPPEHRMKDVVDLLNYDSYLGQQTSGMRRTVLKNAFETLRDYYSQPSVFGGYLEGEKYATLLKSMEFGKFTKPMETQPIKNIGAEDVQFSTMPSKTPSYPSLTGSSGVSSIASPFVSPSSRSTSPSSEASTSPSDKSSIVSSPTPSKPSSAPSLTPSNIPQSKPPEIPPYKSTLTPSISPPTSPPYIRTYTPSIVPPTTPTGTPTVSPPSLPPRSPPSQSPPYIPPTTPKIPGLALPDIFGGGYGGGNKKRFKYAVEIFPMGLDISMFGKKYLPRNVGKKKSIAKRTPTKGKKK